MDCAHFSRGIVPACRCFTTSLRHCCRHRSGSAWPVPGMPNVRSPPNTRSRWARSLLPAEGTAKPGLTRATLGRTPTTPPGCGLPAWPSGCACPGGGPLARRGRSTFARLRREGRLAPPLTVQRRGGAVRHMDLPGAWVQPRSHAAFDQDGSSPPARLSVQLGSTLSAAADAIVPQNVASGRVSRWVGGGRRGPAQATASHFPSLWWVLPQEPVVSTTAARGDGDLGRIRSGSPGVADQTSSGVCPDRPAISGQTEADSGHIQRRVSTGNEHGTSSAIPTEDAHRW